jgi:hypothetical protein
MSGSVIQRVQIRILVRTGHHEKKIKKNFDSYCFVTFFTFLSLKNDVNKALSRIRIR